MVKRINFLVFFVMSLLFLTLVTATATNQKLYNVTASCKNFDCTKINITILAPNSSTVKFNQSMTNAGAYAYYQFTPNQVGEYTFYVFDNQQNYSSGTFKSSSTGTELTTANSVIYAGLFALIFFIFFIMIFFINKLPDRNTTDEEGRLVSITWLKYLRAPLWFVVYFLFIAIIFISSNLAFAYLGEQLFAKVLFSIYRILMGLAVPIVVIWIVWIFVSMFHDKQFQKMINKGIFPKGRL